jgi:tetratricopeptide (TPR) repeat protein
LLSFFKRPATAAAPDAALAEQIERARTLHQQQQLAEAAALYREILAAHPQSAEVQFRHANVLKDQGELEAAVDGYARAIALKSDYAHAFCNQAVVLGQLRRFPEAVASYDCAIALDPTDALAHYNRAGLLNALGQKDAALAGFSAAIANDPGFAQSHFARGALLQEREEWDAALECYDRALAINAGDAVAYYNRGTVLRELKRWAAALDSYDRAIALNQGFFQAHAGRAQVFDESGRLPEALESYDRALEQSPNQAATYNNRAVVLQKMGRFAAALASYDQAIAANPDYLDAYFNRGTVLAELDDFAAALASYEHVISRNPRFADAYVNRGCALEAVGSNDDAIASYKQGIAIKENLPEGYFNLALATLKTGDLLTGWSIYEWRWRAKSGPIFREKREFTEPLWLGKGAIADKTILLYGEQGLGDSLQFCRYVAMVANLGMRVILEVPRPLVNLCATVERVTAVIPYGDPLPAFDFQCPLMSLPFAFATTLETIPTVTRYLHSDAGKVAAWQERLGARVKPRIGLTWSGNQAAGTNRRRHFPLAELLPYLPDDFQYFCLQTDMTEPDRKTLAENPRIIQFDGALRDFSDTAALCECLDLVISVDTSVAHLSGALGKKTWVLLAFVADWRWLIDREDSPWYPTMRLYRQKSPGNWEEVFQRVAAELLRQSRSD